MRFEPAVDRDALIDVVSEAYAVRVRELTFVPASSRAACYQLVTDTGVGYFLKLWLHLRLGEAAAATQHASLALTRALHDRGAGLKLPYPLLTIPGALWTDLSGVPVALFPLLRGKRPAEPWPGALYEELGRAVAALHRATDAVADVSTGRETLNVAFELELQANLNAAAQMGPAARPGLLKLRGWVLTRQDDVLAQLKRLRYLQIAAHQIGGPFVLCHTDLHHNNLLLEDDGTLDVLDWDDVKLAPAEHDLWAGLGKDYRGESIDVFLDAYWQAGGSAVLHGEHFAFYLLRRYLDDLNVCLCGLLARDADGREDVLLLDGMEECFERWSRLEATLSTIAAALRKRRT